MRVDLNGNNLRRALFLVLMLALAQVTGNGEAAQSEPPSPDPPVAIYSVEARHTPDSNGTTVTLRGEGPLRYSVASLSDHQWSLILEDADASLLEGEIFVGSTELDRIIVQANARPDGGRTTQIDFFGALTTDKEVRAAGNELFVEFTRSSGLPTNYETPLVNDEPVIAGIAQATEGIKQIEWKREPEETHTRGHAETFAELAGLHEARRISIDSHSEIPHDPYAVAPSIAALGEMGAPVLAIQAIDVPEIPLANPYDLTVNAGKSLTMDLEFPVSRVSVTDSAIVDAVVISPEQLLLNGMNPGDTSLILWSKTGEIHNYDVMVSTEIATLQHHLTRLFPNEGIRVASSRQTVVLHGTVSNPEIGLKVEQIASDYSANVVNNMTYPPEGRRQIMLKIVFAEVNRSVLTELSSSLTRIDPNNPRGLNEGLTTTGDQGTTGNFINTPQGPDFSFNEAINFFAFSASEKIAAFITALKSRGLVQILAEPTLIAADGESASFLAGGEFPIPVAQAGAGFTSVTIIFKKFGISLDFTPKIREDGTIMLQVEPEVSALDFANAVVLAGFTIPSLTVRRASTQIDLKDGQSFAIAGLYSAELQQTKKKVPLLGDIPLLGYLFRSKNLQKRKTELLVIATPTIVEPKEAGEEIPLPKLRMNYDLDKKKDKNKADKSQEEKPHVD